MNAATLFRKAILLLDLGNDNSIELLKEAIDVATRTKDDVTLYGATCCLGEVMLGDGRYDEARSLLTTVATLARSDDVLAMEQERAQQLLDQIP